MKNNYPPDISISRCPHDKKNPYVMTSRELIHDSAMSPQARFVLIYLLSLPDDWQIYHSHLQKSLNVGETYLNSCFEELIREGYVTRTREKIKGVFQPYKYQIREFKIKVPNLISQAGRARPENQALPSNEAKPSIDVTYYKDLGHETLACFAKKEKTLDVQKRWKLTDYQFDSFNWLKSQNIDADDKKLCFWAKSYTLQRLIDVYNESIHNKARSLRMYMGKLLEENKVVFNSNIQANIQFAKDFSIENGWASFRILKKYVTFQIGSNKQDIDLNFDPPIFMQLLFDSFDAAQRYA